MSFSQAYDLVRHCDPNIFCREKQSIIYQPDCFVILPRNDSNLLN